MGWPERDAERLGHRVDEMKELESALAAMTADRIKWQEAAAKAAQSAIDYKVKLEAVEDTVTKWGEDYCQLKSGREFYRYAEDIQRALGTTGTSLKERLEKVLAQWRGQHWIYTQGEVIRRTCIEEVEAALKGE